MKKFYGLVLVIFVLAALWMSRAQADDQAASSGQLAAIEKKQDRILQELEELKAELQIVKIRITSR